jgi:hypothetical protein
LKSPHDIQHRCRIQNKGFLKLLSIQTQYLPKLKVFPAGKEDRAFVPSSISSNQTEPGTPHTQSVSATIYSQKNQRDRGLAV